MSTFKAGLLMALERAINGALAYDPATQQALTVLDGKVLQLACTAPQQSVYVLFVGSHMELWSLFEGAPDVVLSGTPGAFLHLWRQRNHATALASSGVALAGDVTLLQQVQKISGGMDMDWEALLAAHTGDVIAHQLGRSVRGASVWLRGARREAERLLGEFLQFESDTLPGRYEVQGFCRGVDALQLRMDRLQARIDLLQQQRNG